MRCLGKGRGEGGGGGCLAPRAQNRVRRARTESSGGSRPCPSRKRGAGEARGAGRRAGERRTSAPSGSSSTRWRASASSSFAAPEAAGRRARHGHVPGRRPVPPPQKRRAARDVVQRDAAVGGEAAEERVLRGVEADRRDGVGAPLKRLERLRGQVMDASWARPRKAAPPSADGGAPLSASSGTRVSGRCLGGVWEVCLEVSRKCLGGASEREVSHSCTVAPEVAKRWSFQWWSTPVNGYLRGRAAARGAATHGSAAG